MQLGTYKISFSYIYNYFSTVSFLEITELPAVNLYR